MKKKTTSFIYHIIPKNCQEQANAPVGPGFELTICDLSFKSQIQSFTGKHFQETKKLGVAIFHELEFKQNILRQN